MDTPAYNVKYYSHNPSATNNTVKYDEEQREVTESTSFVHIRKKPPIIQTIVLPPPPAPVALVSLGNGSGSGALDSSGVPIVPNNPLNPPAPTVEAKRYVLIKMGVNNRNPTEIGKQDGIDILNKLVEYGGDAGLGLYEVLPNGKFSRVR